MAQKSIVVLGGSPRAHGNSDCFAECFARGVAAGGGSVQLVHMRAFHVQPCTGCHACVQLPKHACVLGGQDDAEQLFALVQQAPLVLIVSPIYFYALPAGLKAFVDRAQRFWAGGAAQGTGLPLWAGFIAGRPRGEKLFAGSELCLRYFAAALGRQLTETLPCKGYDAQHDLQQDTLQCAAIEAWGRKAAATAQAVLAGSCSA
ncbi:MAG: NAD(P)H-dependent oxidoreductase [Desulfovibrionaceae bacterium]|nr:NAD(P)H-dependent oxidoreductase [Desulfovibrionaceae bacterium]